MKEKDDALKMIKEVYEESEATINGRAYKLLKMKHQQRKKIFGFFSSIQKQIKEENYAFFGFNEWDMIEEIINNHVTFDGDIIGKKEDHFDQYPSDYLIYAITMMGAMSFPFLPESLIN